MEWNSKKELVPRKGGLEYIVSPWTLICREENYYLAAFDEEAQIIKHYRVDKMANIRILSEMRAGAAEYDKINPAEYTNSTFSMYGGELEDVSITFPTNLIGVVIDRFGKEIPVRPQEDKLKARVKVVVSPPFFGWLASVGKDIQIVSPVHVKEQYVTWLETLLKEYK
jgi:predicted DNA-binding transcriptional regulator YafY